MNLLMISGDRSVLSGKRGAFWYTLEAFSKHWGRIDIICPYVDIDTSNPDTLTFFGNVHFHPSPQKSLWSQPAWILKKGMQLHALFHHNVMTVHEYPPFYNGIGARKLLKRMKIGSVLELHHLVGYPDPASLTERIGRMLSRLYLPFEIRSFDVVRTVSKPAAERLLSWKVQKSKVSVVPSFYLDHQVFAALQQPAKKQYDVAFCGRLVENKGLDTLLRAIAKRPRITLLVIGDGPERKRCEELARQLDISERVEFRGWLAEQDDVLRTLMNAKVFVMNSLSEGGPRIALEAMACGLPVVVTKVGVMPDVIEDGKSGLFTSGTPDNLIVMIERLLQDEALRIQMGQEAKGVLQRFEREKLIANYARFLQSVGTNG